MSRNNEPMRSPAANVKTTDLPREANKPGTISSMEHRKPVLKVLLTPSKSVVDPPNIKPIL